MSDKPEALQLANWFEGGHGGCELEAAAELRRLHKVNQELLEALRDIGEYRGEGPSYTTPWQDIVRNLGEIARAAIAKAEGQK